MASAWKTGVKTGGKVVIMLDDIPLAFAQSARFRDDYGLEPVHIIGQLQTIEYVPMHARHEIQISVLVVKNTSLSYMGLEPATAGSFGNYGTQASKALGAGIVPSLPADWSGYVPGTSTNYASSAAGKKNVFTVLHTKVFDICVFDAEFQTAEDAKKHTKRPLLWYENCFFAGGDVSVDANRTLVHNVTFYAQSKKMAGSSLQSGDVAGMGTSKSILETGDSPNLLRSGID